MTNKSVMKAAELRFSPSQIKQGMRLGSDCSAKMMTDTQLNRLLFCSDGKSPQNLSCSFYIEAPGEGRGEGEEGDGEGDASAVALDVEEKESEEDADDKDDGDE
ncbi:uncharacterized, partial [Tachysurus ichikawai]